MVVCHNMNFNLQSTQRYFATYQMTQTSITSHNKDDNTEMTEPV